MATITISDDLYERVACVAVQRGMTVEELVQAVLEKYLAELETAKKARSDDA